MASTKAKPKAKFFKSGRFPQAEPEAASASTVATAATEAEAASTRIIEAFRRFDLDNDGVISSSELKTVIQALSPVEWTDDAVRQLLSGMDKSGDGQIQYEEFVEWLMQSAEESPSRGLTDGQIRRLSDARHAVRGCFGHEYLVAWKQGSIASIYDVVAGQLGEGGFGSVCMASHKVTQVAVAIKTVHKRRMKVEALIMETEIMKNLDHPNIVKLCEVMEDANCYYLVMELCTGGELFDFIVDNEYVTEREVAGIMRQIMSAVRYMHGQSICHRDLKPENFLLGEKGKTDVIKVIDFGLACRVNRGEVLRTKAGSPYYVAPEVLAGRYNRECDIWSCGVVMFILFSGEPPFCGATDEETIRIVKRGRFTFPDEVWSHVSEDAKSLISSMLTLDARRRMTAEQALAHSWLTRLAPQSSGKAVEETHLRTMRSFCDKSKLKKVALHAVALLLDEPAIRELKELFVRLDENGDGVVTFAEFQKGMKELKLEDQAQSLREKFDAIDVDWSDRIDYTEFLAATLDKRHYAQENVLWTAFQAFDHDGSGNISKKEIAKVLHNSTVEAWMGSDSVTAAIAEFDQNNDDQINFQEFLNIMQAPRDLPSRESRRRR